MLDTFNYGLQCLKKFTTAGKMVIPPVIPYLLLGKEKKLAAEI